MRIQVGIVSFVVAALATGVAAAGDLKPGSKVQALANLHPDMQKHLLYTLNYQLPGLIPVCSDLTITKVGSKKLSFEYQGQEFELVYEGFSKKAGVSFQSAAQSLLGPSCDHASLAALRATDREGVRLGRPQVGMTRQGVLLAMGRPPVHANPTLDAAEWTYWKNRYVRTVVTFDAHGVVSEIR